MPNPAFIVDGHTEQTFIGQVCPGRPVQRTNLNGKDVTIPAIAKKVSTLIRLFGNRHYPIIILIDREDRTEEIQDICDNLYKELCKENLGNQDIRIGIADCMIENWIVADYKLIDKKAKKPNTTDGINGAALIKKKLGSYNKVIDGVRLLHSIDKEIVYKESPSFKNFIDKLTDLDCHYTNFDK